MSGWEELAWRALAPAYSEARLEDILGRMRPIVEKEKLRVAESLSSDAQTIIEKWKDRAEEAEAHAAALADEVQDLAFDLHAGSKVLDAYRRWEAEHS